MCLPSDTCQMHCCGIHILCIIYQRCNHTHVRHTIVVFVKVIYSNDADKHMSDTPYTKMSVHVLAIVCTCTHTDAHSRTPREEGRQEQIFKNSSVESTAARWGFSRWGFNDLMENLSFLGSGRPMGALEPSKKVGGEAPSLFGWF